MCHEGESDFDLILLPLSLISGLQACATPLIVEVLGIEPSVLHAMQASHQLIYIHNSTQLLLNAIKLITQTEISCHPMLACVLTIAETSAQIS